MRVVIASCSIAYRGRLEAQLPLANRMIVMKEDGSVAIHSDDRSYKPLNWINPPCTVTVEANIWRVVGSIDETLDITV